MPLLTGPVIAAGTIAGSAQPSLIVSEGLRLRPWGQDDAPVVLSAYADPAIRWWHARTLDSTAEAEELIASWQRQWRGEAAAHWAVVDDGGLVLGRVALGSLNLHEAVAAASCWTLPAARRRGVASQALRAVGGWAAGVGFHRLELEHSTTNQPSCAVAVTAGFQPEGIRSSAALHADGWHDMHVHALISA